MVVFFIIPQKQSSHIYPEKEERLRGEKRKPLVHRIMKRLIHRIGTFRLTLVRRKVDFNGALSNHLIEMKRYEFS